jgi:hypothetical protein
MDAALKRSRAEEPAELLPPARDGEEEEEVGMEQELEEEEEVDPRIQVRTSWGPGCAPHPGPARAAAEVGVYTYPRFAAASVHDRGGGGARKPPSPLFGGCSARVDAAWLLRGSPRRPSMELGGSLQHAQRFRRLCNKGKKGGGGAGRVWGTLAWLVATRALYSLLATGCGGPARVGARTKPGGRRPPLQRGLAPVPCALSPHLAEVPGFGHPPMMHC